MFKFFDRIKTIVPPRLPAEPLKTALVRQADRLLLITALILLALLLIFKPFIPEKPEAKPDVLIFTQWWKDELEEDILESIIREFEKNEPGTRISLNSLSYGEMRNSLTGFIPDPPGPEHLLSRSDILALDPLWVQDLIREGRLSPLENPEKRTAEAGAEPSGAWTLPLVSFMTPLFYNIEALQSAGFNRPPRNRSEFLEISRALASQGRFGIALALSPENPRGLYRDIFPWFWAAGVTMTRDGSPALTGRAASDTLTFFDTLRRDKLISPGSFSKTPDQKLAEFAAGQIGMMTASTREISLLREQMGAGPGGIDPFGITALPGPDTFAGKPAFGLSGWHAGISAWSKEPEKARAFIAFLEEKAPSLAASAHAVPGDEGGPDQNLEDPLYSKAWDLYEGGESVREFDGLPHYRELDAQFRAELVSLLEGAQNPAETAAAVQRSWERILEN